MRVISIVGRFLEHSRIFFFQNGGEEEYFIGSADCMKRNLESRVEVVTPVQKPELQAVLRQILTVQLTNQRSVWEMQADGQYIQLQSKDKQLGAQETLIKLANNRFDEEKTSQSHKKAKKKHGANRNTD